MIRLIKRYGSRKLYDTEESRYVSLEELAGWIRHGQEIRVVDNKTGDDVTPQTLTQIISEEGRRGTSLLPNELLHDLIRAGEQAVSNGVEHLQTRVDRFVQKSIDRLGPVRRAREEMSSLRGRLEELERSLADLEDERQEAARMGDKETPPAEGKKAGTKPGSTK
jgi:polyhydroxyalkanoate synthesis repressor PhaR